MTETERLEKLERRVERAARFCAEMNGRLDGIEERLARLEQRDVRDLRRAVSGMGAIATALTKPSVDVP